MVSASNLFNLGFNFLLIILFGVMLIIVRVVHVHRILKDMKSISDILACKK